MRYYLQISLVGFLIMAPGWICSQKLKSMVSSYTYCRDDTTQNVTVDSNRVLIYDEEGRLLRNDNVLDVCYLDFKYDEKGRLIIEEEHCGEGFSIYKYEYESRKIKFSGESTYNIFSGIDSLDENDRPIYHYKKSKSNGHFHGVDTSWYEYHNYYKYDERGNLTDLEIFGMGEFPYHKHSLFDSQNRIIYEERKLSDGYSRYIENWSYTEDGDLQTHVLQDIRHALGGKDSTIYKYDNNHRLINKIHYSIDDNRPSVTRIDTCYYRYREGNVNEKIKALNDSIVGKYVTAVKSKQMITQFQKFQTVIGIKNLKNDTYKASFTYDEKGRITQIQTKNKDGFSGKTEEKYIRINYPTKTKAVLEEVEDFELTNEPPFYRSIYENGLLILEQHFSSSGFMHAYSRYHYTFYK